MPIGPVSDSHRQISVVEPVSPAFEHVKRMLFRPFDLGKWFVVGFCAWLATLGESGGGNIHIPGNRTFTPKSGTGAPDFRQALQHAQQYITNNLSWLLPLAIGIILVAIAIGITLLWLNSRGKFMFLHCVARDKAEVVAPWKQYAAPANSLFWFRLALSVVGGILTLPLLIIVGVLVVRMILRGQPDPAAITTAVGLGLGFFLLAIVFAVIQAFTLDFVVPIQYLRQSTCMTAWKEFYGMLSARPGLFTIYILFQIVLAAAIGVLVVMIVLLTCCIAGCLMAIPYLGTVLMLPVLVFMRAYSLYFLQQFGPQYDVFPPAPPAPAIPPVPGLQPLSGV